MALHSSKSLTLVALHLLLSCLWTGCGPTVVVDEGESGSAGEGGAAGGDGGTVGTTSSSESTSAVAPAITALRAPDEFSIRIEVSTAVETAPAAPEAYTLSSEHGPLKVKSV